MVEALKYCDYQSSSEPVGQPETGMANSLTVAAMRMREGSIHDTALITSLETANTERSAHVPENKPPSET
jgi:hypothetical protein